MLIGKDWTETGPRALTIWFGQLVFCSVGTEYWQKCEAAECIDTCSASCSAVCSSIYYIVSIDWHFILYTRPDGHLGCRQVNLRPPSLGRGWPAGAEMHQEVSQLASSWCFGIVLWEAVWNTDEVLGPFASELHHLAQVFGEVQGFWAVLHSHRQSQSTITSLLQLSDPARHQT